MPWICVTPDHRLDSAQAGRLAGELAEAAATVLGPTAQDVVVLVQGVDGSSGTGAVVGILGRDRGHLAEAALRAAVTEVVAAGLGIPADLVGIARSS